MNTADDAYALRVGVERQLLLEYFSPRNSTYSSPRERRICAVIALSSCRLSIVDQCPGL